MQNTRFSRLKQVACKSPGPAVRTLKRKLLKNFLSVFRDWKFHSQEICELSRENLCVPLTTGPSTREQVANLSCENMKFQFFEKYSKSFSWLKHLLANESLLSYKKSLWWTHDWGMRLVLLATKLPKQGNTIFEIFENFCKNKVLSKNNQNTQKSFCDWSTKIENVKTHLNKYNHTNEYGIHWT